MSRLRLKGFRKDRRSFQHGSIQKPTILIIFTKNGISQDFSIDIMNLLGKREGFHAP